MEWIMASAKNFLLASSCGWDDPAASHNIEYVRILSKYPKDQIRGG